VRDQVDVLGSSVTLGADLTAAGAGDDGSGAVRVQDRATVRGDSITLRGADVNLGATASVGRLRVTEEFASVQAYLSALAFDATGNLYVAESRAGRVSKVTPAGAVIALPYQFNNPEGLAFDASGNLYVAERSGRRVSKVTPAGAVTTFATGLVNPA